MHASTVVRRWRRQNVQHDCVPSNNVRAHRKGHELLEERTCYVQQWQATSLGVHVDGTAALAPALKHRLRDPQRSIVVQNQRGALCTIMRSAQALKKSPMHMFFFRKQSERISLAAATLLQLTCRGTTK